MYAGSDMPIFGDDDHPCISLRLHSGKRPINILTGLDYWLDNLMCQVPEVLMCYHMDGLVQKYEVLKTEDLPNLSPESKFSPKVVRDVAKNVLNFLKRNVAVEGHTYWLFKGKEEGGDGNCAGGGGDDVPVKLYDLTALIEDQIKQEGDKAADAEAGGASDPATTDGSSADAKVKNPFSVAVGMLLYRVAKRMVESRDARRSREVPEAAKRLLENCLQLLDREAFPHLYASAKIMLSEVYIPADECVFEPGFPGEVGGASGGARLKEKAKEAVGGRRSKGKTSRGPRRSSLR